MATLDHFRSAPAPRVSLFSSLSGALSAWLLRRATVRALSQLTPRELNDLGLAPADVDAIARGERPAYRV